MRQVSGVACSVWVVCAFLVVFGDAFSARADLLPVGGGNSDVSALLDGFVPNNVTVPLLLSDHSNAPSGSLLQLYLPGDANQDGVVGSDDLETVLKNYGQPGTWATGDFNGDGVVDFADLGYAVGNYGQRSPNVVPEPGTLALLAVGLCGLLAYRWKRRN